MSAYARTSTGFHPQVALKKAASQQPVAVAIQADQRAFQLYVGGVFDDKECGTQLDHGVLVGHRLHSHLQLPASCLVSCRSLST